MANRVGLDIHTVIDKAAEMANADGLQNLNMAALASALGVRSPTLYHYVKGLNGLHRALSLRGIAEISQKIGRATMGKSGDDAVIALAQALWAYAKESPGVYEAAQRAPDVDDEAWRSAGRELVELMILALSAYQLSHNDARQVVRMLRSTVHGCVSLQNLGGFSDPLEADDTFERMLEALVVYLSS